MMNKNYKMPDPVEPVEDENIGGELPKTDDEG